MSEQPKRRQVIDPAVAALMRRQDEKEAEAKTPKAERAKRLKERMKAADRLPGRVNLDLPPALKKQVFELAEAERIPVSQVVAFLLAEGMRRLRSGELTFNPYRRPSKSPRYDWNLDIDDLVKNTDLSP